jgi:uncharacterized lipoprotein YddW (UPF0748 family)
VKRSVFLCLLGLLPLLASVAAAADRPGHRSAQGSPHGSGDPALAVWVARDRLTSARSIEEICRAAREAGVGTLVVQVRGRGDAYYRTGLAPRAQALDGTSDGFDPLAEVLKHAQGLRVLAWINVFLVWSDDASPRDPAHVVRAHQDWLLKDVDGRPVATYGPLDRAQGWIEGIYADPASPEYREHFARLAAEIAGRYAVDGIHLDFVRYAGAGYGRGGALGDEFLAEWGLDPRWLAPESELVAPDVRGAMPSSQQALARAALAWADLRAAQVTELVRAVRKGLRQARPGVELSAAVFPDHRASFLEKGQDWRRWAREGLVDALYPMAYFGGTERVAAQLAEMRQVVDGSGVRLYAGLGAYLKESDRIGAEAGQAWSLGFDGVSLYDVGTLLGRSEGLRAYAKAVVQGRARDAVRSPAVLTQAGAPQGEPPRGGADALGADREARRAISRVLARLEAGPAAAPAWVDLHGIFRFVHPLDGAARRQAQRRAAEAARDRLLAGEEFGAVAAQVSQWGTRSLGGTLPRRHLAPSEPTDVLLARTDPGSVTGVLEEPNGYWVYRVDAKGGGEKVTLAELPWPARRALLREELSREMDRLPESGLVGRGL